MSMEQYADIPSIEFVAFGPIFYMTTRDGEETKCHDR